MTEGWYNVSAPAFTSDGKYLAFVSARDFNPTYSQTEWNHSYGDMSRVYIVPLSKASENPFRPKIDENGLGGAPKEPAKDEAKGPITVKIDLEGITKRSLGLPITPANYRNLASGQGWLYYIRTGRKDGSPQLLAYDLSAPKEIGLGSVNNFEISADGKKMMISQNGKYGIIDLPRGPQPANIGDALDLGNLSMKLDRAAEFKQIFAESWRQMRDFFYAPNMHGVDWQAMRLKYEPLVAHAHNRTDLTYIIGEMIGELNAGHAYVGDGDAEKIKRVSMGLLGATLERDPTTGAFKVVKVLEGANWDKATRSPLTEYGSEVKPGEFITAVNGKPTSAVKDIQELLLNTADKPVVLTVAKDAAGGEARKVTVTPLADESKLRYYEWVQSNIDKVSKASGGKIGYIHVPNMMQEGLNEFVKHYYPQITKKALLIDMRGNGGGNVSPMLIERLRREAVMYDIARNGKPSVDPSGTFIGPMACLLNEYSASDGDLFPYRFKTLKMGPLIGKRSWGGVVGIRGSLPFVDGGSLNRPEFSRYALDGKTWAIEGHGVDPDIEVANDPAREFAGEDEQLKKGIEVLLGKLKDGGEKSVPPVPVYPKR